MALQTALAARYGQDQVRTFADVARSDPGAPVSSLIERAIGDADIVLAVIGSNWLTGTDEAGRTLADPDDRVRRELELALEQGVGVAPVTIDANLPAREQLPGRLARLPDLNAVAIRGAAFQAGMDSLYRTVDRVFADTDQARTAPPEVVEVEQPVYSTVEEPPRQEFDWETFPRLAELATLRRPAREGVSQRTKTLRNWFGLIGLAVGAAAGWYASTRDDVDSNWLAVFIGILVFNFLSRAAADVLSEPKKVRRLLYFALTPALAGLSFYYTYQWWETWWLSFLLGFAFGGLLNSILGSVLFPAIHKEETADTRSRWRLST